MKYGRLPRVYGANVLHLSQLRRRFRLKGPSAPAPPVDYTVGMPANLGAMLNDSLGDCTIAALYHRRQVITFHSNPPMDTQPDATVESGYELMCGYNPADPSTDQGGDEQSVLTYCVGTGMPLADGSVDKLGTFIEIDTGSSLDIDWAINDCLGIYTGFNVPSFLQQLEAPRSVWGADPSADNSIIGGHAVYVPAHLANGNRKPISWGSYDYEITPAFWLQFFDEAYALIGDDLLAAKTGQTILGMTVAQLTEAVQELAA